MDGRDGPISTTYGTLPSTLHTLFFIFTTTSWGRVCIPPGAPDEKTEAPEVQWLSSGHTGRKWKSQNLNPNLLDSKQNKKTCLDQLSLCHCLRTQPREVDRTEFGFRAPPIPRRVVLGKSLNFAGPQLLEAWADWPHIQKQLLLLCFFFLPCLWSSLASGLSK